MLAWLDDGILEIASGCISCCGRFREEIGILSTQKEYTKSAMSSVKPNDVLLGSGKNTLAPNSYSRYAVRV